MNNRFIKFFFLFIFFNVLINATTVATINIAFILQSSDNYNIFLEDLNKLKQKTSKDLKQKEDQLLNNKKDIEDSKIFLTDSEFQNKVNEYEIQVKNFENKINENNFIISKNIELNKSLLIKEIILISQNLAIKKKIDIILNEDMFFISSDNLDVSNDIIDILNNSNSVLLKIYNKEDLL